MGGLWGKLWWRTLCAWGLALGVWALSTLALVALPVVVFSPHGVLDFAGGAVVHLNPWGPLICAMVPWLAAEAVNLRRSVPIPFGSYVAFAAAFILIMAMMGYVPEILHPHRGWAGIAMPLVAFALAVTAGLAAGSAYARLTGKQPKPEAHF